MLNYDACVRLIELHCRRAEAEAWMTPRPSSPSWPRVVAVGGLAGVAGDGEGAESAVAANSLVPREKSMKMWLLEQPLFACRDLNRL